MIKQTFGYSLILCCIPLLLFVGTEVWNEIAIAQDYEAKIENSMDLPKVVAQLPVTLHDHKDQVFSEEYVEWREPLDYEDFPHIVKNIFIYSEDVQFYNHIGFDVSAIARAVMANASGSIEQGASTITQQLVRMRYLSEDKTYERKLMELFFAYELEQMYSKEEILGMYLNEMYFGNQVYGIGSAATYYFGRSIKELTIAEIAFLAAIPNNPSLYNPIKNFDRTKERQERLLDTLAKHSIISANEAESYKLQPITLQVKQKKQQYPAYSAYALQELRWLIASQEGLDESYKKAATEEEKAAIKAQLDAKVNELLINGIHIYTALDPNKQLTDEDAVNRIAKSYGVEASATVIDNETREIVSIFAGTDYEKSNLHRAFQAPRQPGSAFKPLIDYAPAMEVLGYTPQSSISGAYYCVGNFCPENYGGSFYGTVSLSTAFSRSYNTSALRLLNQVGLDTAFNYIDQFTFRSIVPEDRSYAAALGGLSYGVTSAELADAYTSFIDGSYTMSHTIRKVTDLKGNVLYAWPKEPKQIWSAKTVRNMRTLLSDVVYKGTGAGLSSSSGYIGAKTGTTNGYRDYWVAGLTNNYTTAVWIGYDQPKSMQHLESSKIHFKIFNAVMD